MTISLKYYAIHRIKELSIHFRHASSFVLTMKMQPQIAEVRMVRRFGFIEICEKIS